MWLKSFIEVSTTSVILIITNHFFRMGLERRPFLWGCPCSTIPTLPPHLGLRCLGKENHFHSLVNFLLCFVMNTAARSSSWQFISFPSYVRQPHCPRAPGQELGDTKESILTFIPRFQELLAPSGIVPVPQYYVNISGASMGSLRGVQDQVWALWVQLLSF